MARSVGWVVKGQNKHGFSFIYYARVRAGGRYVIHFIFSKAWAGLAAPGKACGGKYNSTNQTKHLIAKSRPQPCLVIRLSQEKWCK